MKVARKAMACLLTLALVGSAAAAAAETPENAVGGQTVISREFRESLFNKPWQDEAGAVVSFDNLDVAKTGDNSQQLLFAGVREEDPDIGGPTNVVAEENQREGSIVYKLTVKKETQELYIGMIYRTNTEDKIQVFVSDSETFPEQPAAEFHGPANEYNTESKSVAVNPDGKEAVYVKIVLPYGGLTEDGWIDTGIHRLNLSPAVTDALHTTDTSENNNNGGPVLVSDLSLAGYDDNPYKTWGAGIIGFSGTDEENNLYPPEFKLDRDSVFCASQTFEGQWGYSPRTSYLIYKVNTVSAMEEAVITATIRVANTDGNADEYKKEGCGDDVEAFYLEYSTDGTTWTKAAEKIGDKSGVEFKGDLTATLTAEQLNGTDTLYVRATNHIVAWPDWAYMSSLKIETKGANPEAEEPGTDPGTDPGSEPGTDPGSDPGTDPDSDPGTNPGSDSSTDSSAEPDADSSDDNPDTGVAGSLAGAALLAAVSAAAVLAARKSRRS